MQDGEEEEYDHYVIPVHIWQTAEQAARYRALRSLCPADPIRPAIIAHLQAEIEGIGLIDDVWTVEVGRADERTG